MSEYRNAEYYPDPTPYKALKNIEKKNDIKRGDIYMMHRTVDKYTGAKSGVKMPVVIVSADSINEKAGFVMYIIVNDNVSDIYDSNVSLSQVRGCAVCSKICTGGKKKLAELVGVCSADELEAIDAAILASLGIAGQMDVAPPSVTKATPPPEPTVIVKDDPEKDAKIIRLEAEKAMLEKLYKELLQSTLSK